MFLFLTGIGLVALDKELGCLEPELAEDSVPMKLIRLVNEMFVSMQDTD